MKDPATDHLPEKSVETDTTAIQSECRRFIEKLYPKQTACREVYDPEFDITIVERFMDNFSRKH